MLEKYLLYTTKKDVHDSYAGGKMSHRNIILKFWILM